MRDEFLLVTVKEWLKSVLDYRKYRKNKTWYSFFWTTLYKNKSGTLVALG